MADDLQITVYQTIHAKLTQDFHFDLLRCLRHEARAAMAEQDEALARELSDNLSAAVKLRLRVLRLNKVFMRVLRLRAVDIALERRGQLWPVLSDLDGLLAGSDL